MRVIAGAGSGKTKLLVARYAYLVKEYGIDSANILCVTFTNKAAGEMRKRIRDLIGDSYDSSLICTYHGFCVRVLREDSDKLFYPKEFQILDDHYQKSILEEIYQKHELKLDHASFQKILHFIHLYKAKNEYVSKMIDRSNIQIMEENKSLDDQIIEEYLQKEKNIFGLDFDDLIYFTLHLFATHKDVLKKWQERLNYIQVDEFQDSSCIEMQLIDLISDIHKNVMIVGDPDQNIYEWRGSDVKLLVGFDQTHIPCQTTLLNQNYRSTKNILTVANALIDNNKFRIKKELYTLNDSSEPVIHFHTKDENDEASKIVEKISDLVKNKNVKYSQIAIIYRSSYLSRIIEKKFTEGAIPYEIFGGVKFYQRMEIQDVMAYLKLIVFDDDNALKRIINTPRRQFGKKRLSKLINLQQNGNSLFTTLIKNKEELCGNNLDIDNLINVINNLKKEFKNKKISDIVEEVCEKTNYEKYIRELGDEDRFDNLIEFKRITNEYEKNLGENISLEDFINQISLQMMDSEENDIEQVKLMTIHAAKGLEFDNVFVIGFSEGIFSSPKTIEERKEIGLEEERRLCYVALTRARQRLFVTDSEGFTQSGKQKVPSRFLFEMGEDNYLRIGVISKELEANTKREIDGIDKFDNLINKKNVGDIVEHTVFGKGKIVAINNNRGSYRIKFDNINSERDISMGYFDKDNNRLDIKVQNDTLSNELEREDPITPKKEAIEKLTSEVVEAKNSESIAIEKQSCVEKKEIDWDDFPIIEKEKTERTKPNLKDYGNLWNDPNVPKTGWVCVGVIDLGGPYGVCEMCGNQIIRYVHRMKHPNYRSLGVGCICAGKMEGDINQAKERENEFKGLENSRIAFIRKKWKVSSNGNRYLKYKNHFIVMFYDYQTNKFKYSIDRIFCEQSFDTAREAKLAIFEKIK